MRLLITSQDKNESGDYEVACLDLNDEGLYNCEWSYPKPKKEILRLMDLKHEVLFESSCYAYLDSYYRDSVATSSAALERFYEFFVLVVGKINKISNTDFEQTWKHVSVQSERQTGAYIFCYLNTFNDTPEVLSNNWKAFRNSVVHKGTIPKKEKTWLYLSEISRLIVNDIHLLINNYPNEFNEAWGELFQKVSLQVSNDKAKEVDSISSAYVTTAISHRDLKDLDGKWELHDNFNLIISRWDACRDFNPL